MATSELAPRSSGIDLSGIANLAGLFLGKDATTNGSTTGTINGGSSTSGTKTTSTNVSPEAVQAIVNSILSGSQGLASVASGEKRAGLYNSSTNQMLINDLISRASAEGAKLNSSTTVADNSTTTQAQTTANTNTSNAKTAPQISGTAAAKGIAGLTALGQLSNSSIGKTLLAKLGLGNAAKTAGPNAAGGNTASADPTEVDVQDAINRGSGFGVGDVGTPNITPTAGAQSIASSTFGNNPSAFVSGDNNQIVNSLTQGGDLSFDAAGGAGSFITDNINGLDFGSGDVSSAFTDGAAASIGGAIGDAAGTAFGDVASNITGSFGAGDFGIDPTTIDFGDASGGFASGLSDLFDFAEGGLVTGKGNQTLLDRKDREADKKNHYADGGLVAGPKNDEINPEAVRDRIAGYSRDQGSSYVSNAIHENDRALRDYNNNSTGDEDSLRRRAILADRYGAMQRALNQPEAGAGRGKGYADGGLVDTTNVGLRVKPADDSGVSPITAMSGDQVINSIRGKSSQSSQPAQQTQTKAAPAAQTQGPRITNPAIRGTGATNTAALQGNDTEGTPGTGISGTPAQNNAAVNGFALGLLSAITGFPVAALSPLANVVGFTNTPITPVTGIINAFTNALGIGDPMGNAAATASAANTAPSQSDNDAAVANGIAADNNSDPMDALVGIVSDPSPPVTGFSGFGLNGFGDSSDGGNDGTSGEGGGIGGSGNSAGDSSGNDGSGDGGASASAATGGFIKGPGTSTSDSIPARLSDGEFVIKAAAVKHFGPDFFKMLNESVTTE